MALNDTYRIIKTVSLDLRPTYACQSVLEDYEEGDVYFRFSVFHISDSEESYTSVSALDKYNAKVDFYVEPTKFVSSYSPIKLGTYQKRYNLFFEFAIKPLNSKGFHEATISFLAAQQ